MPYRRGRMWWTDRRWRGFPRLKLSLQTSVKGLAIARERTLEALKAADRHDLLTLLAGGKLSIVELHRAYTQRGDALAQLTAKASSPVLGPLVDAWLAWCASPAGISPRTRRRFSPRTIARYRTSWASFFAVLEHGRDSRLADLTAGFVADWRRRRVRAAGGRARHPREVPPSPGTMNRDLVALGSFLSWCARERHLEVTRPVLVKEQEPRGRMRWLSAEELVRFARACPDPDWWAFFAVLFRTGLRLGEVQALEGADLLLHARRLTVHEARGRKKSVSATRDVPIADGLAAMLTAYRRRHEIAPDALVFGGPFQRYRVVRTTWTTICAAASIAGATIHDARHTFGVHAAQAGVPLPRLQQLMGHRSPLMTLRYMAHAPGAYLAEDGAAIETHQLAPAKPALEESA